MPTARSKGLTSNTLKIIAVAAMILDHTATGLPWFGSPLGPLFHIGGRLAAPVMCFFIAEGYFHTQNLFRYLVRLFLFALLSHFPYVLCFKLDPIRATGVLWALFLGLLALWACKSHRFCIPYKIVAVAVCCVLAIPANWNYIAVLWVLAFGLFHGNMQKQAAAFLAVSALHLVLTFVNPHIGHPWYQPGVLLALPLLLLYNGTRGKHSAWMKWGFYLFYPLHLIVLYLIQTFGGSL